MKAKHSRQTNGINGEMNGKVLHKIIYYQQKYIRNDQKVSKVLLFLRCVKQEDTTKKADEKLPKIERRLMKMWLKS